MNIRIRKSLAATTIAASVIGGAAAGLAFAPGLSGAQDADTEDPATETPADPGTEDRAAAITERIREQLQNLVDDDTITTAQADAVAADLAADLADRVGEHFGRGPGGRFGEGGPGGPFGHHRGGPGLDVVSELLGLETDEIVDALRDGQTLAELAEANGASAEAVIDALVAEAEEHLADEVADGELTQAEADERLAELTERVTDFVNNGRP
jgi:hypothetical protein